MLNCEEVTRICSDELDRPLRLGERTSLQMHLMMCSGCANYRKQMQTMRQIAQAYAEGRAPKDATDGGERSLP